jgi:RNA polymerase sigma factor (sigma-70 family)
VVRYVYHESYDDRHAVRGILESIPGGGDDARSTIAPLHGGADYDVVVRPVLSIDEERSLFDRLNCLRHLAQKRLDDAAAEVETSQRIAARLLDEALSVRNELLLANQRLVVSIARRFQGLCVPLEDLIAEGNIVLAAAVDAFDCHRGFRFSTYATHAVSRALSRVTRKASRQRSQESGVDNGWLEEAGGGSVIGERTAAAHAVAGAMRRLTPRERKLVELRFGLGPEGPPRTFAELGKLYGVSGESMRQRLARVCNKLRDVIAGEACDAELLRFV